MKSCVDDIRNVVDIIQCHENLNWYSVHAAGYMLHDIQSALAILWLASPASVLPNIEECIFSVYGGETSISSTMLKYFYIEGELYSSLWNHLFSFLVWYIENAPILSQSVDMSIDEYAVKLCRRCRLPLLQSRAIAISTTRIQRLRRSAPDPNHITLLCSLTLSSNCRSDSLRSACMLNLTASCARDAQLLTTACAHSIHKYLVQSIRLVSGKSWVFNAVLAISALDCVDTFIRSFPQWKISSLLYVEAVRFAQSISINVRKLNRELKRVSGTFISEYSVLCVDG